MVTPALPANATATELPLGALPSAAMMVNPSTVAESAPVPRTAVDPPSTTDATTPRRRCQLAAS